MICYLKIQNTHELLVMFFFKEKLLFMLCTIISPTYPTITFLYQSL